MQATKEIIQQYYDSFNKRDLNQFMNLLDEEIIHDINQGERQIGKKNFISFMERMNRCYKEKIKDLVIMVTDDGKRAATEFIVEGTYEATDAGLPPANRQHYAIPCGAFFEIKDGKISRVTNYYNLNHWIKQVNE